MERHHGTRSAVPSPANAASVLTSGNRTLTRDGMRAVTVIWGSSSEWPIQELKAGPQTRVAVGEVPRPQLDSELSKGVVL
jgi:hypothetical protein